MDLHNTHKYCQCDGTDLWNPRTPQRKCLLWKTKTFLSDTLRIEKTENLHFPKYYKQISLILMAVDYDHTWEVKISFDWKKSLFAIWDAKLTLGT